jgi:hypothetical protein
MTTSQHRRYAKTPPTFIFNPCSQMSPYITLFTVVLNSTQRHLRTTWVLTWDMQVTN